MYDGIRKILRQQRGEEKQPTPQPKQQRKSRPEDSEKRIKHHLPCMKILSVKVEPQLVTVMLTKASGEVVELQIDAAAG